MDRNDKPHKGNFGLIDCQIIRFYVTQLRDINQLLNYLTIFTPINIGHLQYALWRSVCNGYANICIICSEEIERNGMIGCCEMNSNVMNTMK